MNAELCYLGLREVAELLRERKLSAREFMQAQLAQIARWNPRVNAIVAKLPDEACLALADAADARAARGERLGTLHGIPWAFKDLEQAVGFPWARGSPIFRNDWPSSDSILVERLRAAGVLVIGKTNTPEFGMGSQTFNPVYGITRNPYDLAKTAGGSSGGAAAALATGMLAGADGSDLAGSLRNPAAFNNVVGFRPSVGLVPTGPGPLPFLGFAVKGPMARTVADTAFLLAGLAGEDARDPGCVPARPQIFTADLARNFRGVAVAWCPDLGGLPLDPRIRAVLQMQRAVFEQLGCVVEEADPHLQGAEELFLILRAFRSWVHLGPLLNSHRDQMKPEAVKEIEDGARLSGAQVASAMVRHGQLMERMRLFQQRFAYMISTVTQVLPFDATLHWPTQIEGIAMEHYIAWMRSVYWISAAFVPAISVPAGFAAGLPVGLQITGRFRDDWGVLQLAHAFEQATHVGRRRPVE
jgi:amidase